MSETFNMWEVTNDLHTEEDIRLYLEAYAEEDSGNGGLIRAALNDIARAQSRVNFGYPHCLTLTCGTLLNISSPHYDSV